MPKFDRKKRLDHADIQNDEQFEELIIEDSDQGS